MMDMFKAYAYNTYNVYTHDTPYCPYYYYYYYYVIENKSPFATSRPIKTITRVIARVCMLTKSAL